MAVGYRLLAHASGATGAFFLGYMEIDSRLPGFPPTQVPRPKRNQSWIDAHQTEALMPRRPTLEFIILLAAATAEAAVLYIVDDAAVRLSLGLLLLAPIVWSASRLGLTDLLVESPSARVHKRRFVHLRGQVQQLLDEIRRLNWMAVDAERGFRSREKALREMDVIEQRLKELIQQIRSTAGQMASENEVSVEKETGEVTAG